MEMATRIRLSVLLLLAVGTLVTPAYCRPFQCAPHRSHRVTTPDAAAKQLYADWMRDDRAAALLVASPAVVRSLFKTSGKGGHWEFQGCSRSRQGFLCSYSYEGGAANMRVRGSRARGYRVVGISYIAD
jgi:hypothetical protein